MKMTAEDAANLASAEELLLAIADTNPVTDSQIDMLVASWEKAVTQEREQISASSKKGTGERRLRKRDWNDDDEDLSDGLTVGKYKEVRGSLDYALTSLSDKEGLTDEELNRNVCISSILFAKASV